MKIYETKINFSRKRKEAWLAKKREVTLQKPNSVKPTQHFDSV